MSSSDKQLRYRSKSPSACTEMFRHLLMIVNLALAVGSLAVIGIAAYLQIVSTKHLTEVCDSCEGLVIFAIALFSTLFACSLLGFCALCKRNLCLLLVYGLYLVLFFLSALAITILVIMVKTGKFDDRMEQVWNDAVRNSGDNLCGLEKDAKCSGWKVLCNMTNGSYLANNTMGCPSCSIEDQDIIGNFTKTCYAELTDTINEYYKPIIIVGFTLAGVALLSLFVSCKVRKQSSDDEDGGAYTRM